MSVPELVIRIPLEGIPRVEVVAGTYEDEQRVVLTLLRYVVLRRVVDDLSRLQTHEKEAA